MRDVAQPGDTALAARGSDAGGPGAAPGNALGACEGGWRGSCPAGGFPSAPPRAVPAVSHSRRPLRDSSVDLAVAG